MKPIVLFDMDGVLCDLLPRLFEIYADKFGPPPKMEEVVAWDFLELGEMGVNMKSILRTPGVFRNLPPIEGAIDGVREIMGMGMDAYILSSPGRWTDCVPEKSGWLDQYLPEIDHKHRMFAHPKWLVYGDYFIDDSGWNVRQWKAQWAARGLKGNALSITCPYNKDEPGYSLLADDWKTPRAAWEQMVHWIAWHKEAW